MIKGLLIFFLCFVTSVSYSGEGDSGGPPINSYEGLALLADAAAYDTGKSFSAQPTKQRVYTCNTCGKTLSTRGNLTVHKRSHAGIKRFSCIFCGQRFTRRSSMRYHSERGVCTTFKCEFCEGIITGLNTFKIHQKKCRKKK